MFGFTWARISDLSYEQYVELRSYYCGVCGVLTSSYGLPFAAVNWRDSRLLALLVDAQTKSAMPKRAIRCPARVWSTRRQAHVDSQASQYAAAVMLFLLGEKLRDDINDERSLLAAALERLGAGEIRSAYGYLRNVGFPLDELADISTMQRRLEQRRRGVSLTEVISPAAAATSLVFSHTAKMTGLVENTRALYAIGSRVGAVILLLDACADYRRDAHRDRYNAISATLAEGENALPLLSSCCENIWAYILFLLRDIRVYAKHLTLHRNQALIGNILQSGLHDAAAAHHQILRKSASETEGLGRCEWLCPSCKTNVNSVFCSNCGTTRFDVGSHKVFNEEPIP